MLSPSFVPGYKASFYLKLQPSPPSPTMIVGLLGGLAKHLVKRTSQLSHKSVSQLRRSPRLQKRALPSTLHSGARMCPQGHNKVSPADQNSLQRKLLLFCISSKVYGQIFMAGGSPKDTKLFTQKYREKAPFGSQHLDTLATIHKI